LVPLAKFQESCSTNFKILENPFNHAFSCSLVCFVLVDMWSFLSTSFRYPDEEFCLHLVRIRLPPAITSFGCFFKKFKRKHYKYAWIFEVWTAFHTQGKPWTNQGIIPSNITWMYSGRSAILMPWQSEYSRKNNILYCRL